MLVSLTSSQALAFNLFFPFLGSSRSNPDLLQTALGIDPEPVSSWRFEAILDTVEGTNFDVAINFPAGRKLLVEVKLTEPEFGVCKDNEMHPRKLRDIYRPRLINLVAREKLEPRPSSAGIDPA